MIDNLGFYSTEPSFWYDMYVFFLLFFFSFIAFIVLMAARKSRMESTGRGDEFPAELKTSLAFYGIFCLLVFISFVTSSFRS